MTFKSIESHLRNLDVGSKLFRFEAPKPFASKRALYLTPGLAKELGNTNSNVNYHKAAADCERMMERWVMGQPINVTLGGRGTGAMLARLDPPPDDVWEMRITDPSPQFRIFCQFAAPDMIVAAAVVNRSILGERARGRKRSAAWSDAMYACAKECGSLLSPHTAFHADSIQEYVTENGHAV